MNLKIVIFYYFIAVSGVLMWFVALLKILRKNFFTQTAPKGTLKGKEKIAIKFHNGFMTLVFICLTVGVMTLSFPAALDFPYVLKGDYLYVNGTVIKVINNSKDNTIIIRDRNSKKEVSIYYVFSNYEEGEEVNAYYLPHMKIGTIRNNDEFR